MLKLKQISLCKPTKEQIEQIIYVSKLEDGYPRPVNTPTNNKDEWSKDHLDWVVYYYLPKIKPPMYIWRICVEAYLSGMELQSDGSTFVLDLMTYKEHACIKDPQGVAHDYIFWLHRHKLKDAYGKEWKLNESNEMYRVFHLVSGTSEFISNLWWVGLDLFSWYPWWFK